MRKINSSLFLSRHASVTAQQLRAAVSCNHLKLNREERRNGSSMSCVSRSSF